MKLIKFNNYEKASLYVEEYIQKNIFNYTIQVLELILTMTVHKSSIDDKTYYVDLSKIDKFL